MQFPLQDASSLHNKTSADTINLHDNCTDLLTGKLEQLRTLAKRTACKIKHEQQETDKMLEQASREFGPPLGSVNLIEAFYSSQGKHSDLMQVAQPNLVTRVPASHMQTTSLLAWYLLHIFPVLYVSCSKWSPCNDHSQCYAAVVALR